VSCGVRSAGLAFSFQYAWDDWYGSFCRWYQSLIPGQALIVSSLKAPCPIRTGYQSPVQRPSSLQWAVRERQHLKLLAILQQPLKYVSTPDSGPKEGGCFLSMAVGPHDQAAGVPETRSIISRVGISSNIHQTVSRELGGLSMQARKR
jgi:hypothetical protein